MVVHLQREIERLKKLILRLSAVVEKSLQKAARSLEQRDANLAKEVIEEDFEIDKMEVVYQAETLGMGWCLDCHRNPEAHLRPVEKLTVMDWMPPEGQMVFGRRLREQHNINPRTDCWTCHR